MSCEGTFDHAWVPISSRDTRRCENCDAEFTVFDVAQLDDPGAFVRAFAWNPPEPVGSSTP